MLACQKAAATSGKFHCLHNLMKDAIAVSMLSRGRTICGEPSEDFYFRWLEYRKRFED